MLSNTIIDRTNRFYIEMSRKVISEKEYDILQKLLIEKMTLQQVGEKYGVTGESVRKIYERAYNKVKSVTDILADIDHYKKKLEHLKADFYFESSQTGKTKSKVETDLNKLLYDSYFPFSKRMYTMFETIGVRTIGDLSSITLKDFSCFRGFKGKCKDEFIAFVEFENIEHLFKGFAQWKKIRL